MASALDTAVLRAREWLDGLDSRSVAATADVAELKKRLGGPLPECGTPADQVIDALAVESAPGHLGSASGRFYAWVIGGSVESALAADWLVSAWDQNAALYSTAPAAAVIEEIAGEWLKELLDLPREASFAFTTGCQMAHFTALAAARHALLSRVGWDVEADGLSGAPRLRVLAGAERHASVDSAVRYLGLGSRSIRTVETDGGGMIPAALERDLAASDHPAVVVLNAADLNIGACDRFPELIPLARKSGAWVHVDGAFGLFARASRAKRRLVEGLEEADSWATDGHKWLNVPFDCGVAFVRDRKAHRAAMTLSADYLTAADQARDAIDWTPEWSRRARSIPVYAALRELGREGVERMIDRCCERCLEIVRGIGALEGAEIVAEPTLNQGLLRFGDRTDEIIARINRSGEAFFSGTTWRGRRAMRVSVVNWRTSERDVERAVAAAAEALRG